MVVEVGQMRHQSLADFREATELLRRLIEFTEPHEAASAAIGGDQALSGMNAIREEELEQMVDMSPPRVVESRNAMKQVHSEMLSEINQGGAFSRDIDGLQQQVAALDQEVADSKAISADAASPTAKKSVLADG